LTHLADCKEGLAADAQCARPAVAKARERRRFPRPVTRHAKCFFRAAGGRMTDILLVLSTAAFFALSWGYARLCEKL
jgi:hypothetical protein